MGGGPCEFAMPPESGNDMSGEGRRFRFLAIVVCLDVPSVLTQRSLLQPLGGTRSEWTGPSQLQGLVQGGLRTAALLHKPEHGYWDHVNAQVRRWWVSRKGLGLASRHLHFVGISALAGSLSYDHVCRDERTGCCSPAEHAPVAGVEGCAGRTLP